MNPELRRDADHPDEWVSYAQGLLADVLADDAADGQVQLSAIDDKFGPITEGSVRYFQEREGLAVTGVIDAATWEALGAEIVDDVQSDDATSGTSESQQEAESDAEGGEEAEGAAGSGEPLNLRVPFELLIRWEELELARMLEEFERLELSTHPNAQLTFPQPVGRLFGNGGLRWLEFEFRTQPTIFVEATTRAIVGWSSSQGLELGADNDLDAGLRFQGFDLFLRGEFDARLHPMVPSGSISGSGTINIRLNIDSIFR